MILPAIYLMTSYDKHPYKEISLFQNNHIQKFQGVNEFFDDISLLSHFYPAIKDEALFIWKLQN